MKHAPILAVGFAACALVTSTFVVAATPAAPPAAAPVQKLTGPAADDPVARLFVYTCNECHDAGRITAMRRTKTDWEEVINKMIENGANGTPKDFETIYDFLLRFFGKVYINSATADDLKTIVGLTQKDADAIVAYRKANGNFADFDALKKVPELDVQKLEDHKDAVAF